MLCKIKIIKKIIEKNNKLMKKKKIKTKPN